MRKLFLLAGFASALALAAPAAALAQGDAKQTPPPSVVRDPDLEKESLHNLQVARHYFRLKKAYRAALARCEEIMAGDPTFSRLDEVLYLAGMSSLKLSENKGKQAANAPPDKLREEAREYGNRRDAEYPESRGGENAEAELRTLGAAAKKR